MCNLHKDAGLITPIQLPFKKLR